MNIIYGVDTEKEVTPLMVRDAIVECFYDAHCADASLGDDVLSNKGYCGEIVKKMFKDVDENFEKPSKEAILKVIKKLGDFSINFRGLEIIKKHEEEIMKLVEKLK